MSPKRKGQRRKMAREEEMAYRFPALNERQKELLEQVLDERNLHNIFLKACGRGHLKKDVISRIEHDVKSDIGLRINRIIQLYDGRGPLEKYINTCIYNLALDAIRRQSRLYLREKHISQLGEEEATPEKILGLKAPQKIDPIALKEIRQAIGRSLIKLPKRQREIFLAIASGRKKYREVAERYKTTIGSIKSSYVGAKKKLRGIIKRQYPDFP